MRGFSIRIAVVLFFMIHATASAQSVLDRAKDAAKRKAAEKIESRTSTSDDQSDEGAASEPSPRSDEETGAPAKPRRAGADAWANFDYVPGETVLFAEDFSKDRVGNFPQRFELSNGTAEIVEWQGKRWLRSAGEAVQFTIPLPKNLPDRFTLEFDAAIPWWGMGFTTELLSEVDSGLQLAHDNAEFDHDYFILSGTEVGLFRAKGKGRSVVDPVKMFPEFQDAYQESEVSPPVRVRLHVDGKYVKMYLDEKRVVNVPNANLTRGNKILFVMNAGNADRGVPMVGNFTINAGGRDMYDALSAEGRVATQGILFDSGKDTIRPESSGTLAEIARMLTTHGDLRLLIEGHTDNVGDDAANQALSEKRAAAVKTLLVTKHRIATSRLETRGFGASKPRGRNDTPEGRQNNRRVELVKL